MVNPEKQIGIAINKVKTEYSEEEKKRAKIKLLQLTQKAILTATIGAIASIEEVFGEDWGYAIKDDNLNPKQKEFFEKYQQVRSTILDKGNKQIRALQQEIENKFIIMPYLVELTVGNNYGIQGR